MSNRSKELNLKQDSICVSENREIENGASHVLPINASSAFSFKDIESSIDVFEGRSDGFVYSRYANPTIDSVERKLAALESVGTDTDVHCILTGSGMSAIATLLLSLLNPGDALFCQQNLYGGSSDLIRHVLGSKGIEIIYGSLSEPETLNTMATRNPNIKLIYFESPSNPCLDCVDIQGICDAAKKLDIKTVLDNTFSTSYIQQALPLGVDYVVYSTTKFLNGHGNGLAGAIICRTREERKSVWNYMKLLGTNASPFEAWLLHNGLKTLAVRLERHCHNALRLAEYLEAHEEVVKVNYPGLESSKYKAIADKQMQLYGAVLSFELKGGLERAKAFMNACKLCTIASTLGNVDTLLLHPATSSHLNIDKDIREEQGITDGLIRISVGIENIDDIIRDVSNAIDKS